MLVCILCVMWTCLCVRVHVCACAHGLCIRDDQKPQDSQCFSFINILFGEACVPVMISGSRCENLHVDFKQANGPDFVNRPVHTLDETTIAEGEIWAPVMFENKTANMNQYASNVGTMLKLSWIVFNFADKVWVCSYQHNREQRQWGGIVHFVPW